MNTHEKVNKAVHIIITNYIKCKLKNSTKIKHEHINSINDVSIKPISINHIATRINHIATTINGNFHYDANYPATECIDFSDMYQICDTVKYVAQINMKKINAQFAITYKPQDDLLNDVDI